MKLLLLGGVLLWTLMIYGPSLSTAWVVALKISIACIFWTIAMEYFCGKKFREGLKIYLLN